MRSRRWLLTNAIGLSGLVAVAACSQEPSPTSSGPVSGSAPAHSLTAAWGTSRSSFLECFTPEAQAMGAAWYTAWNSFSPVHLTDSGGGQVLVDATVPSQSLPERSRMALTVERGRIAEASAVGSEPIWFRSATRVQHRGEAAIVAATDADTPPWLASAIEARDRVESLMGAEALRDTLVCELPGDVSAFQRRFPGTVAATTAAYTDATEATGARVLLNPEMVGAYGPEDRLGLLTHEGVHALLRTPLSEAPLMLVEGLAEWAAVPVWPAARRADAAALDQGDASALPDDADFSGTDQDVASAYARSEVLVAGCVERWGVGAVVGWVTDWSSSQPPDAAQLTDAYTAELTRRR